MCCLSNKEINTRQKFRRDELTKNIMHSASKTLSSHSKEKYPRCYFFFQYKVVQKTTKEVRDIFWEKFLKQKLLDCINIKTSCKLSFASQPVMRLHAGDRLMQTATKARIHPTEDESNTRHLKIMLLTCSEIRHGLQKVRKKIRSLHFQD